MFLGDPLGFFHHCFLICYHFSLCFHLFMFSFPQMFLLLIAFVHFTVCQVLRFCVITTIATDLRECFFHSDVFYLTLLPDIWHNLLLLRLLWGQQFCLEGWRVDLLKSLTLIHCFLYFLIFSLLSLVGTSVRYLLLLISSKYPFTLQKGTKVPRIYTIAF